ncbi:TIGR03546 family protein [bacterium]|nr:TIGR03546 family protein [bacterium]
MFWLNLISKLIKAFREGQKPWQIALGFALGYWIGLLPSLTLQGVALILVLIFLNVNLAAATLGLFICELLAFLLDPLFHSLGYSLLVNIPGLHGFWETVYNWPVAPLSQFNNTVVLGSFVFGAVTFIPVFWAVRKLVLSYRSGLGEKVKRWKIVQLISGSKLLRAYNKVRNLGGI